MRSPRSRWLSLGVPVLAVLGLLGAGALAGLRLASTGTAYTAKMLCSEVFVAGREPLEVLAELQVDDVRVLRAIGSSVDRRGRMSMASLFGMVERRAYFRDGAGCALMDSGVAAGTTEGQRSAPVHEATMPLASAPADDAETAHGGRLEAVIDAAFSEPRPWRPRRTRAVVVMVDRRIVAERYAPGLKAETPLLGWSMSKTAINALAGVLVKQHRLSLDMAAPIPEWMGPDDPRRRITVDHLMRMSSGLEFDEGMTSPFADVMQMLFREPDMARYAAGKPLEAEPGRRWAYSSGTSVILARVIRQVVGDAEYRRFPKSALFDRLGMTRAVLECDASGTFVGSSFMYATARDWARLGALYIQDGVWNGERILPEGWVGYTRTPAPADPRHAYGAHVWLAIPGEYDAARRSLPPDAFHAAGHEGQFVTIVPSRRAVIVRLGKTRYPEAWDHGAFVADVLAALEEEGWLLSARPAPALPATASGRPSSAGSRASRVPE